MNHNDRLGDARNAYEKNRERILKTQCVCGICGREVDMKLKYPHPMSATIDHIIPVDKGGHPSDISNLQLAHWTCNRQKSNKFLMEKKGSSTQKEDIKITNRDLPQPMDWSSF